MPTWRAKLGSNAGGVTNYAEYDDNDRTLTVRDYQSGSANQAILDDAHAFRRAENEGFRRRQQATKVATIPITIWHNWRREWETHCKQLIRWQDYLLKRINDADYAKLRTTEKPIPTRYERDKPSER